LFGKNIFCPTRRLFVQFFSDGDRIYSGSYKEFGYWKRSGGKMFYFSISKGKNIFLRMKTKKFGKFLKLTMPSIFNPLINFMFMKKVA
jgi:hypothetical protein